MSNYFDDDDAFWDGPSADPDRTSQIERSAAVRRPHPRHTASWTRRAADQLDDGSSMWIEPSSLIADRLGPLGSVDPRVLSIGAVALAVCSPFHCSAPSATAATATNCGRSTSNDHDGLHRRHTDHHAADVVVVTAAVDPDFSGDTDDGGRQRHRSRRAARPRKARRARKSTAPQRKRSAHRPTAPTSTPPPRATTGCASPKAAGRRSTPCSMSTRRPPRPRSTRQHGLPARRRGGPGRLRRARRRPNHPEGTPRGRRRSPKRGQRVRVGRRRLLVAHRRCRRARPRRAARAQRRHAGHAVVPGLGGVPAGWGERAGRTDQGRTDDRRTDDCRTATTEPPTTAAPATTDAPATTAEQDHDGAAGTAPPAEIEQIIRDVWPDDLEEQALRIAWRESGYNPAGAELLLLGAVPDLLRRPRRLARRDRASTRSRTSTIRTPTPPPPTPCTSGPAVGAPGRRPSD